MINDKIDANEDRKKSNSIEFFLLIFCYIELWIIIIYNKLLFVYYLRLIKLNTQWHFKHFFKCRFDWFSSFRRTASLSANQIWMKIHKIVAMPRNDNIFSKEIFIHEMVKSTVKKFWKIFQRVAHYHHWRFSSVKNWLIERTPRIAFHHQHHHHCDIHLLLPF